MACVATMTERSRNRRREDTHIIWPDEPHPIERHGYRAPTSSRVGGFTGSVAIGLMALCGFFLTWTQIAPTARPSAALVVNLLPPASPRAEKPDKPKPEHPKVKKDVPPPVPPRIKPVVHSLALPAPALPAPAEQPQQPTPQTAEQPVAKAIPAPPAPQPASNAPDSWEGRVLARIAKYRRYPGDARHSHQQGVVYVRFRMNRSGHVLTASITRSSGFANLDQAALDTVHRADPLPPIPPDRPEELELAVPIEFYIR